MTVPTHPVVPAVARGESEQNMNEQQHETAGKAAWEAFYVGTNNLSWEDNPHRGDWIRAAEAVLALPASVDHAARASESEGS